MSEFRSVEPSAVAVLPQEEEPRGERTSPKSRLAIEVPCVYLTGLPGSGKSSLVTSWLTTLEYLTGIRVNVADDTEKIYHDGDTTMRFVWLFDDMDPKHKKSNENLGNFLKRLISSTPIVVQVKHKASVTVPVKLAIIVSNFSPQDFIDCFTTPGQRGPLERRILSNVIEMKRYDNNKDMMRQYYAKARVLSNIARDVFGEYGILFEVDELIDHLPHMRPRHRIRDLTEEEEAKTDEIVARELACLPAGTKLYSLPRSGEEEEQEEEEEEESLEEWANEEPPTKRTRGEAYSLEDLLSTVAGKLPIRSSQSST